ncbi:hypothetical protein HN789_05080 [archaeon]|jgi:hypothetical protein|nr:hypothetical protein [archaeon]MBT4022885.1 hypothetical protein [archaeon]MBT4272532.1 hypothetical protein [archaeon]MBT4460400.1 hypothetical protein [archaeon]MBT4859031.1 hypothetical protein [archaeon]
MSLTPDEIQALKLKKKLEKYTKDISRGLDLNSQNKSLPLERVNTRKRNPLFSKETMSTIGSGILILLAAYLIYLILSGKIPIAEYVQKMFK